MATEELILFAEMVLNTLIAVAWALGATMAARDDPFWRWPVSMRWLVALWLWGKAAVFGLIVASFFWAVGFGVAEAIIGGFTVVHVWAFIRWARLPVAGAKGPER